VSPDEMNVMQSFVRTAHELLHSKTGLGNDFLGWMNLPETIDPVILKSISESAEKIISDSEVLIVVGIGGSYLGARAVIEFLKTPFYNNMAKKTPDIYFAGNNMSPSYIHTLLSICKDKNVSVNVVSKSGTTVEPGLAFRILRKFMEEKYGIEGARSRIYVTTDSHKGNLKTLADSNGYKTFPIPDDVGGRFSVLTSVGLLPIAVAGIDIHKILDGAKAAMVDFNDPDLSNNACYKYAALRNCLSRKGKLIEILACYDPSFAIFAEWFKQLFGESEGKDGKGIFPSSVIFSTDLHSMGQYIQDGNRILFETVLDIETPPEDIFIDVNEDNFDGLNFLANRNMSNVNRSAFEGTIMAHTDGGVPNIILQIPSVDEFNVGYLIYFFEKSCALSGYLLGVNPFNQPGVEHYKRHMINLLKQDN
jgi:glucose-6-phosphate isomerase